MPFGAGVPRRRRTIEQAHHLEPEPLELGGMRAGGGGERLHGDDAVGLLTDNFFHRDAADALKQEVGGVVLALLTGADDTDGRRWVQGLREARLRLTGGVELGDGEHAVASEHIAQHLLITGLEDMQRQQGLREEHRVRQSHHGNHRGHVQRLHARNRRCGRGFFNPWLLATLSVVMCRAGDIA
jgi:hypothetical protein